MEAPVRVVSRADFQKWVSSLPSHGYPWGINGAGRPKSASPYPGNDQLKKAPNQVPGQTNSTTNAP
jgi:heme/copper-type cytochrome/quinol oxidase subunit 2